VQVEEAAAGLSGLQVVFSWDFINNYHALTIKLKDIRGI